jgi:hypothetical protein
VPVEVTCYDAAVHGVRCGVSISTVDVRLSEEELERLARLAREELGAHRVIVNPTSIFLDYVPSTRLDALLKALREVLGRRPV